MYKDNIQKQKKGLIKHSSKSKYGKSKSSKKLKKCITNSNRNSKLSSITPSNLKMYETSNRFTKSVEKKNNFLESLSNKTSEFLSTSDFKKTFPFQESYEGTISTNRIQSNNSERTTQKDYKEIEVINNKIFEIEREIADLNNQYQELLEISRKNCSSNSKEIKELLFEKSSILDNKKDQLFHLKREQQNFIKMNLDI